jgi:hypothetical protein
MVAEMGSTWTPSRVAALRPAAPALPARLGGEGFSALVGFVCFSFFLSFCPWGKLGDQVGHGPQRARARALRRSPHSHSHFLLFSGRSSGLSHSNSTADARDIGRNPEHASRRRTNGRHIVKCHEAAEGDTWLIVLFPWVPALQSQQLVP